MVDKAGGATIGHRGNDHLHLWDVFDPDAEQIPEPVFAELGRVLSKTWRAALAEQFPGREFDVRLSDEPGEYGPTVIVRSVR